jgi:hypothetical protein
MEERGEDTFLALLCSVTAFILLVSQYPLGCISAQSELNIPGTEATVSVPTLAG